MQQTPPPLRVNVEYCKSCDTHTWCTHHDQQKYVNTFKKLKQYLQKQFPNQLVVTGNLLPQQLTPIKPAQNKYYNQKTNKYVQYPVIGAFQITIEGEVVFSKKKTNTWPNLVDIGDKVHFRIFGYQRPHRSIDSKKSASKQKKNLLPKTQQRANTAEGDIRTQKDNWSQNNQSFMDNNDKRSTFYKPKNNYKNFTLTDHFKNYHNRDYKNPIDGFNINRDSDEFFTSNQTENDQQNMSSEMSSYRIQSGSERQFLQFKQNFEVWTNKQSNNRLSQLLKRKGQIKQDGLGGKKQMIIRLDSIEQQSILVDENGLTSSNQGQKNQLKPNYFNNTHSTFKSRPKENTHKQIMRRFNDDFDELQEKFKNFQQRVENIREENKKFDYNRDKKYLNRQSMPKIMNEKLFRQIKQANKKQRKLKSSQGKDIKQDDSFEEQDMVNNPIIFAKRKLKNIEDYINGTQEEKNEKLKKIYGEWKLFRKPYKGKNYISPYRMDLLSRIGTGQTNQKNPRRKKDQMKHYKEQESSEDSSFDSSNEKQVQTKNIKVTLQQSKIPRMPPMPSMKSPKGQEMMTQHQFYTSSRQENQQVGTKKLPKKSSQVNARSSEKLRKTQNQFHRAAAGAKINTVDQIRQMQQKTPQVWSDKKEMPHKSFIRSKQKVIKNGRVLKSIEKTQGQAHPTFQRGSSKIRRNSKSQKNLNQFPFKGGQFKFQQKQQGRVQKDQFIASGHSNDSQKVFKNFRTKKNQNASKSKEKQSYQNQQKIHKNSNDLNSNQESQENVSYQESYNNSQSLQNNYFKENPSQNQKPQARNLQKASRVKKGYEKGIGQNKQWKQGHLETKQKIKSNQYQERKSKSKNKGKQTQQNNSQFTGKKSYKKSVTEESFDQNNESSSLITSQKKLQKKSRHQREKHLQREKSKKENTLKDQNQHEQIRERNESRREDDKSKYRKQKKHQTIVELKDLDHSQDDQEFVQQSQQKWVGQNGSDEEIQLQNQTEQNISQSKPGKDNVKTLAKIQKPQNKKPSKVKQNQNYINLKQNQEEKNIQNKKGQNSNDNKTKRKTKTTKSKETLKKQQTNGQDKKVKNKNKQQNINQKSKNKNVQAQQISEDQVSKDQVNEDQNVQQSSGIENNLQSNPSQEQQSQRPSNQQISQQQIQRVQQINKTKQKAQLSKKANTKDSKIVENKKQSKSKSTKDVKKSIKSKNHEDQKQISELQESQNQNQTSEHENESQINQSSSNNVEQSQDNSSQIKTNEKNKKKLQKFVKDSSIVKNKKDKVLKTNQKEQHKSSQQSQNEGQTQMHQKHENDQDQQQISQQYDQQGKPIESVTKKSKVNKKEKAKQSKEKTNKKDKQERLSQQQDQEVSVENSESQQSSQDQLQKNSEDIKKISGQEQSQIQKKSKNYSNKQHKSHQKSKNIKDKNQKQKNLIQKYSLSQENNSQQEKQDEDQQSMRQQNQQTNSTTKIENNKSVSKNKSKKGKKSADKENKQQSIKKDGQQQLQDIENESDQIENEEEQQSQINTFSQENQPKQKNKSINKNSKTEKKSVKKQNKKNHHHQNDQNIIDSKQQNQIQANDGNQQPKENQTERKSETSLINDQNQELQGQNQIDIDKQKSQSESYQLKNQEQKKQSQKVIKTNKNSIKQETSKSLLGLQGQTQRLNTARSIRSKNKIIGVYKTNQKDSDQDQDKNQEQEKDQNLQNQVQNTVQGINSIEKQEQNKVLEQEKHSIKINQKQKSKNQENQKDDNNQRDQNNVQKQSNLSREEQEGQKEFSDDDNVGHQQNKHEQVENDQENTEQGNQQKKIREYRDIGIQIQSQQIKKGYQSKQKQNYKNKLQNKSVLVKQRQNPPNNSQALKQNNPNKQQIQNIQNIQEENQPIQAKNQSFAKNVKTQKSDKKQLNLQNSQTVENLLQPTCIENSSKLKPEQQKQKSLNQPKQQNQRQKSPIKSIIRKLDILSTQQPQLDFQMTQRMPQKSSINQKKTHTKKERNEVDDIEKQFEEDTSRQNINQEQREAYDQEVEEIAKVIRAPITKQFYGESFKDQIQLYPSLTSKQISLKNFSQSSTFSQTLPQNSFISKLPSTIVSKKPHLFNHKSIEVHKIVSQHPLPNVIKCLKILADINEFLIIRLFENPSMKITKNNVLNKKFGVWLCINYEWKCVIVDLNQILLSSKNAKEEIKPFYLHHTNNQIWPIVLETALAKALNNYKLLTSLPCHKIFNILTGSNSLFFNIKEDPSKNNRILRYITDCENKNFILHAQKICKNLQELQRSEKQTKIYYVMSQKIVNENQILLQIRESIRPDSQWMKLTKFVQEFKSIEILQLRLNHNFSSIKLPKPMNTSNLTIIELDFLQQSFGSITLSTSTGQLCPLLKTYLYKQEKSNVLKLVGQAKEKNKATLFFDCFFGQTRYYLFVESSLESRVTYLGENQPLIRIIEEINSDGLKNDFTEYLPIKTINANPLKMESKGFGQSSGFKMPNKLSKSRFGETGMSFKSQQDEKISRLRENFVEYLLKGKQ